MFTDPIRPCPHCHSTFTKVKYIEPPFVVVRCLDCSLVYLGNPPENERLYEEYYGNEEPLAEAYHQGTAHPALREIYAINRQRLEMIEQFISGGRLLDIGCGRGFFLKSAHDRGFNVSGIDISARAVEYVKQSFDLAARIGTPDSALVNGERFDVITLWHVLEHFTDPFRILPSLRDMLNDGGLLCLEVPNIYSLKFLLERKKWHGGNHPLYHRTFFSSHTLRHALEKAGFRNVRRMRLSYHIPDRQRLYEQMKSALNVLSLDAFLDFCAWK